MKETRLLMNMPITVEIADPCARRRHLDLVFDLFRATEDRFSPFKESSETTRYDRGFLRANELSFEMKLILRLAEETRDATGGYFDAFHDGHFNPVGIVKGWVVRRAARLLLRQGLAAFYIEAGGDIQLHGRNAEREPWLVGIRSPFALTEIVKVLSLTDCGVATSGTYARGDHIYDPVAPRGAAGHHAGPNPGVAIAGRVVSLTVIGPDAYEADRFATGAFAMGRAGIEFIERLEGFEGYMIDDGGMATYTSRFNDYVADPDLCAAEAPPVPQAAQRAETVQDPKAAQPPETERAPKVVRAR
jgi:FAD:protein FMN transferase